MHLLGRVQLILKAFIRALLHGQIKATTVSMKVNFTFTLFLHGLGFSDNDSVKSGGSSKSAKLMGSRGNFFVPGNQKFYPPSFQSP